MNIIETEVDVLLIGGGDGADVVGPLAHAVSDVPAVRAAATQWPSERKAPRTARGFCLAALDPPDYSAQVNRSRPSAFER
jgi:hypothetical protein